MSPVVILSTVMNSCREHEINSFILNITSLTTLLNLLKERMDTSTQRHGGALQDSSSLWEVIEVIIFYHLAPGNDLKPQRLETLSIHTNMAYLKYSTPNILTCIITWWLVWDSHWVACREESTETAYWTLLCFSAQCYVCSYHHSQTLC